MSFDPKTLAAITLMALATYACRGGGYWLFRQIKPSPLLRSILSYVPGALFVSFVVPAMVQGGVQAIAGGIGTIAVMLATRNTALSIIGGVAVAWAVWALK